MTVGRNVFTVIMDARAETNTGDMRERFEEARKAVAETLKGFFPDGKFSVDVNSTYTDIWSEA